MSSDENEEPLLNNVQEAQKVNGDHDSDKDIESFESFFVYNAYLCFV